MLSLKDIPGQLLLLHFAPVFENFHQCDHPYSVCETEVQKTLAQLLLSNEFHFQVSINLIRNEIAAGQSNRKNHMI